MNKWELENPGRKFPHYRRVFLSTAYKDLGVLYVEGRAGTSESGYCFGFLDISTQGGSESPRTVSFTVRSQTVKKLKTEVTRLFKTLFGKETL